jgi:hypothetical protein
MHVDVQMRDLLERRFTDRMPETDSLVRESFAHGLGYADHRRHQRRARLIVQFAHVLKMTARYDQGMTSMKLPEVDKRHREPVLIHNTGRHGAGNDLAKDTIWDWESTHSSAQERAIDWSAAICSIKRMM